MHVKEKPFICEIFSNFFLKKGSLDICIQLHTKEKTFTYEMCSKGFSHKRSVIGHLRKHA